MIQGEGSLPFPRDRFSWLIASILFAILLLYYYGSLYSRLEEAYRSGFDYPTARNSEPLQIHMASPKYISSMAERDLLVSITNPLTRTMSVLMVPKVDMPDASGGDYFVFIGLPDIQGEFRESGALHFTNVPPGATVSQAVSVKLIGRDIPAKTVDIEFDIIMPDGEGNNKLRPLDLRPSVRMRVDSTRTLVQNLIAFVLLPPWSNGFLPLVALFAVYLYGMHEVFKCHRYQPLMWGWLALLLLTTIIIVGLAGEIAIAILGETGTEATRVLVLAIVAAGFILASWLVDHQLICSDTRSSGDQQAPAGGSATGEGEHDKRAAEVSQPTSPAKAEGAIAAQGAMVVAPHAWLVGAAAPDSDAPSRPKTGAGGRKPKSADGQNKPLGKRQKKPKIVAPPAEANALAMASAEVEINPTAPPVAAEAQVEAAVSLPTGADTPTVAAVADSESISTTLPVTATSPVTAEVEVDTPPAAPVAPPTGADTPTITAVAAPESISATRPVTMLPVTAQGEVDTPPAAPVALRHSLVGRRRWELSRRRASPLPADDTVQLRPASQDAITFSQPRPLPSADSNTAWDEAEPGRSNESTTQG